MDGLLILLTPLLATPAVLILYSSWVGVTAETISLIVTAFFATGHHLPGLIRAYGDRELFERFSWRFILAPPLVFLAYFPLFNYHFDLYRLIILVWATWHGLMQLYGFVRIYDAKVGSTSPVTAYWDWLLCLCGFVTPLVFRPERLSSFLDHWYASGGPMIPPGALSAARTTCLAISLAVLAGFALNYVVQSYRGPKPNPLKLLMLASGIGMWWFAMMYVENLILGVALFDICHDVQYLAIVWLYNCRRVSSNPRLGGFMSYVFRRGMVLLYLGLITAYGAIGLVGPLVADGTVSRIFYGILFTSTILHYYYDGFIWKVREPANQAGLGLSQSGASSRIRPMSSGKYVHALKWAPLIVWLGLLFTSDFLDPSLTTSQKEEIDRTYAQALMAKPALPPGDEECSWLYARFERAQNIAAAVPDDRTAQLRAAILLGNFGRHDEAVDLLEKLLRRRPADRDALLTLGEIQLSRGSLDQASACFESALSHSTTPRERSLANLKLGQVYLLRNDLALATAKFKAAVQEDPQLAASIDALRNAAAGPRVSP
ncbi:MAG: tetratricopeptide repeat protein [Planctomycetaceae bacterium]